MFSIDLDEFSSGSMQMSEKKELSQTKAATHKRKQRADAQELPKDPAKEQKRKDKARIAKAAQRARKKQKLVESSGPDQSEEDVPSTFTCYLCNEKQNMIFWRQLCQQTNGCQRAGHTSHMQPRCLLQLLAAAFYHTNQLRWPAFRRSQGQHATAVLPSLPIPRGLSARRRRQQA